MSFKHKDRFEDRDIRDEMNPELLESERKFGGYTAIDDWTTVHGEHHDEYILSDVGADQLVESLEQHHLEGWHISYDVTRTAQEKRKHDLREQNRRLRKKIDELEEALNEKQEDISIDKKEFSNVVKLSSGASLIFLISLTIAVVRGAIPAIVGAFFAALSIGILAFTAVFGYHLSD